MNEKRPYVGVADTVAIRETLKSMASQERARQCERFFKTAKGEYGHGDVFLGIRVPELRKLAKKHASASLAAIMDLLRSSIHEHRQLALFILCERFRRATQDDQKRIVTFYLNNTQWVNNWDLVDASAHLILGAYLLERDKAVLYRLAASANLWERRIAIVSTWHFIRNDHLEDTFRLAALLLADDHDLIHKSVGWMLREAGKRDEIRLVAFLEEHYRQMPRTMLRYAIELFPEKRRQTFLKGTY